MKFNCCYVHSQTSGAWLFQLMGVEVPDTIAVQLRINGEDLAQPGGPLMYGSYAMVETLDSDFTAAHWPEDPNGNLYQVRDDEDTGDEGDLRYEGEDADAYRNTYFKQTNSSEDDWNDIIALREHVPLGIMREIHRWGAHAMVITTWLHMMRVFLTGSYKPPREFNWGVGVLLLTLTLLLSFTGYLLPWDQLAIWAITVGAKMAKATPFLGHGGPGAMLAQIGDFVMVSDKNDVRFQLLAGRFVGEPALLRFYILHCVFIPLVASVLMAVHFWGIRKDGGISGPL